MIPVNYLIKGISIILTPIIAYFLGRNIPFFQKNPLYLSQLILIIFVIVGYLLFG